MSSPSRSQQNRLGHETSPYLLQHKDNPVDWWPWGPEALAEAKSTNRPILLSVGYAACHWCHVMAHESFEDEATAAVMNKLFVNIKVDREERPDIDQIYMSALHHLGEQGGWPLTMFLTPSGEPVWGGTYFPKESRYGRPAFVDVLQEVARLFRDEPAKIGNNRDALMARLAQRAHPAGRGHHDPRVLAVGVGDDLARVERTLEGRGDDHRRAVCQIGPDAHAPAVLRSLCHAWNTSRLQTCSERSRLPSRCSLTRPATACGSNSSAWRGSPTKSCALRSARRMPSAPVPAFALPVLTTSAATRFFRCFFDSSTGAAQKRFCVKAPATAAPGASQLAAQRAGRPRRSFGAAPPA